VSGDQVSVWGRPKGSSILAPLLRILSQDRNEHGEGRLAELIAQTIVERAIRGDDISGLLKLVERIDGAVIKRMEHSIQADRTIVVHPGEYKVIPELPGGPVIALETAAEFAASFNQEERVALVMQPSVDVLMPSFEVEPEATAEKTAKAGMVVNHPEHGVLDAASLD
jgi:hypothetical protein